MRRFLVFAVFASLFLGLAPTARASQPERFVYEANGFYLSWRDQRPVSANIYLKIYWNVYASDSREGQERSFRASVYRNVDRCERQDGRDRCHNRSRMQGIERDLADVTFWVDPDLGTAGLTGAFRLRQVKHHEVVALKNVEISARLVGRGDVYRSRSSYTNWDGTCPESRYRFEDRYHRASARVSMTGDVQASLKKLKRASIFDYNGFVLRRKCD
jgi:hypothetical protein